MPNIPTIGAFIPGFLNTCNSTSPSGQGDAYGNIYPSGLTPGKVIMLSAPEARMVAAPTTQLYDGAYQWVQLDSGATAANALVGNAAYIRLDSGPTVGALPETSYEVPTVTTGDIANQLGSGETSLFAGVFINPSTNSGASTGPTPGNYCFIFVGAGRAQVQYTAGQTGAVGNQVTPSSGANASTFASGSAAASIVPIGVGVQATASGGAGVAMWQSLIYRVGGQGV